MKAFRSFVLFTAVAVIAAGSAIDLKAQSDGFEIWVANQGLDKVQVIDGRNFKVIAEIELDADGQPATSKPHMLLFSPDYKYAFVANPGDNTMTEILTDTRRGIFEVGRTISTGTRPICLMFTADSRKAYVSLGGDPKAEDPAKTGGIEIIDVARGEVVKRFENTGKNGCGLIRSKNGQKMFANAGDPIDEWMAFNTKTDELLYTGSTEVKDAHAMWISPAGSELWIFGRGDNQVAIFDTTTYAKLGAFSVGDKPDIADASPDSKFLFAALRGQAVTGDPHAHSGTTPGVAVIDVAKKEQIQTIPLPGDPHGLAVRPLTASAGLSVPLLLLALAGLLIVLLVLRR